jgi:hypothetical protein
MAGIETERDRVMTEIAQALHDMCQPLTALHCMLEIAQRDTEAAALNGSSAVWTDCVWQCDRLTESVVTMRNLIRQARVSEQGRDK